MTSLVVMGVAGCGKSSVGRAVAAELGLPLVEGDEFHPAANVAKMRVGTPLDDADRTGWLDALGTELQRHPAGMVLSCSALKRAYRERLRAASPGLRFMHLALSRDEARRRVAQRESHYFGPTLIDSQFDSLEDPRGEAGVLSVDATESIEMLVGQFVRWIGEPVA